MIARWVERTLWCLSVGGVAVAFATSRIATRGAPPDNQPIPTARATMAHHTPTRAELSLAVRTIVEGDLFRRERHPVDSAATPIASAARIPGPAAPPKPRLVLRGIMGGPPWDAVLEGVPGRDGNVVVRVGDRVSGLTIRALKRDTVVVRGFDTTWTLTITRP